MTSGTLHLVRTAAFVAAFALVAGLQRVSPHARLRGSWRVNGPLALVNAAVTAAVCGGCFFATAAWVEREGIGLLHWSGAGVAVSILGSVVALDLVAYWWHRANHVVGALWRFHQVHHSDEAFTASTALRFHPGEILLSLPVRLAAIVASGASLEGVLAFEIAFTLANFVEHGDIALPRRLERSIGAVLITPALHRRHHTKAGRDRDTNYGTIFAVWDQLFGSRTESDSGQSIVTGVPGVGGLGVSSALLLPVRRRLNDLAS